MTTLLPRLYAAWALIAMSAPASAASIAVTYPTRPIRIIVPFAAGGPTDIVARTVGQKLTETTPHLAMELFRSMANISAVPYKGSSPAATDLVGGQLQLLFDAPPSALPFVRGGKLRALGISTAKRTPLLPEMPTISEAGVPGYEVLTWSGICAPAGTPHAIIAKLNEAMVRSVTSRETRERFGALGADVVANSSTEYQKFILDELAKWSRVIKDAGVAL